MRPLKAPQGLLGSLVYLQTGPLYVQWNEAAWPLIRCGRTDWRRGNNFSSSRSLLSRGSTFVAVYPHSTPAARVRWALTLWIGFFKDFFFNWSVIDIQCCVNFWCTAKWFKCVCVCVCVYTYIFRSVFIPITKKSKNVKRCPSDHTIAHISHSSKVMLKILQAGLQRHMNCELPYVQAVFRKGSRTRDQIVNIHQIIEKAREFQRNIYFCFIDYAKVCDCMDHNKW